MSKRDDFINKPDNQHLFTLLIQNPSVKKDCCLLRKKEAQLSALNIKYIATIKS